MIDNQALTDCLDEIPEYTPPKFPVTYGSLVEVVEENAVPKSCLEHN